MIIFASFSTQHNFSWSYQLCGAVPLLRSWQSLSQSRSFPNFTKPSGLW